MRLIKEGRQIHEASPLQREAKQSSSKNPALQNQKTSLLTTGWLNEKTLSLRAFVSLSAEQNGELDNLQTFQIKVHRIRIQWFGFVFICFWFWFEQQGTIIIIIIIICFLGSHLRHMEIPRLGVQLELQLWPTPQPQPQQPGIQAASATHTTAQGNTGSPTHPARPGIKPASGSLTTEP